MEQQTLKENVGLSSQNINEDVDMDIDFNDDDSSAWSDEDPFIQLFCTEGSFF